MSRSRPIALGRHVACLWLVAAGMATARAEPPAPAEGTRAALKTLAADWHRCFEGAAVAPAITLLVDDRGRLATVALDRPGPMACLTPAVGRRLADSGPLRIAWPAVDRPSPFPPPPARAPAVVGRSCPDETAEARRPTRACVSADGTRIWLPTLPRLPQSRLIPTKAYPVLDDLVTLLESAPQIARVRIEMHDYRDPHAGERAMCHACARARAITAYLADHGIDRGRLEAAGAHVGRPAPGRAADEAQGPPRYEVHIEGWMPPGEREAKTTRSAPRGQGEGGAIRTGPRDAEE